MEKALRIVRYASPTPGPRLTFLGSVHGDEICGALAIDDIIKMFESQQIELIKGSVAFVPVCNVRAHEAGQRYIDHNLNRDLRRRESPVDYEDRIGNILCPLLEETDCLLDIHSYDADGPAFLWAGADDNEHKDLRRVIGTTIELYGWEAAYNRIMNKPKGITSVGTVEYARSFGGVSFTLECGQSLDPKAPAVAKQAILNVLTFYGLIEGQAPTYPLDARVKLENIYWAQDKGRFTKKWRHLDKVSKGEVMAIRENGEEIRAQEDGYIIFPKENCPVGDEWLYFGVA